MKKKKENRILDAVLEILAELVLTAICFGIGYGILRLVGMHDNFEELDTDIAVLLGTVVFVAVFLSVVFIAYRKKHKGKDTYGKEDNMKQESKRPIYVFDLDGTLVDSMPYFTKGILSIADEAGLEYDDSLIKILTPLGYTRGAEYYVNVLGVDDTVENIYERIEARLVYEYSNNITTKPGVKEFLEKIYAEGARMFVLTASPHSVTDVCLKRNGVFDLFEKVWSVDDFGLSKSDTPLFWEVARTIGCEREEIHYFDDSLIALENAKKSGYITYGVYDAQSEEELERMKNELSDVLVMSFEELL